MVLQYFTLDPLSGTITEEQITAAIDQLENEQQKDFIRLCLRRDPKTRPTAIELLFHPAIFEVHSLKLLAAHVLVNSSGKIIDKAAASIACVASSFLISLALFSLFSRFLYVIPLFSSSSSIRK